MNHPTRKSCRVYAVVLAAGSSSRLGRPKQLLVLNGEPLLAHVLQAATLSSVHDTVVVLGHAADEIGTRVGDSGQRIVINPEYADGQSTSLRAGLQALPDDADAAVVLLGDQPRITPALIDAVIGGFCGQPQNDVFVQPVFGGTPGNPVLIGADLFGAATRVVGDKGVRELMRSPLFKVLRVSVDGDSPLDDVDTEDDYQALLSAQTSR